MKIAKTVDYTRRVMINIGAKMKKLGISNGILAHDWSKENAAWDFRQNTWIEPLLFS